MIDLSFEKKIIAPATLSVLLPQFKRPLVFTNGCFDILHRGHVNYLAEARELGKSLIVALNSDASIKRQGKGDRRPLNSLEDRLAVFAALDSVSWVSYFEEDTPLILIQMLKPDILVKGGDWPVERIVGSKETQQRGGQVFSIPFRVDRSTTGLIHKIRNEP